MKQTYIWVAVVLLLVLNIVLMLRLSQVNRRIDSMKNEHHADAAKEHRDPAHEEHGHHSEGHVELAVVMGHLQRHANKLYFAGQNSNWPLAGFYVHEIEEAMEEVADGQITDEGINISKLMEAIGLPALEILEASIKAQNKGDFDKAYLNLVNTCNTCHQSSKHEYIVIDLPKTPALDNQKY